jgi:hypothetical protein
MASEGLSPQSVDRAKLREDRFMSHTLVEVKRFKWLPIGVHSAVLLDVSSSGFKAEFTGEHSVVPGNQYWLNIPLSPLGIYIPKQILCRCECRWFDHRRFRMGGTFIDISKKDQVLIDQIITEIKRK